MSCACYQCFQGGDPGGRIDTGIEVCVNRLPAIGMEPDPPFPNQIVGVPELRAAIATIFRIMEEAHLLIELCPCLWDRQIIAS